MFNTRQDLTEWTIEQFNKYGIRQPEIYTEQEIKDVCPEVPSWAITKHVKKRNIQLLDEDDGYHD
jgi:3-dehydroquinate dehydratase